MAFSPLEDKPAQRPQDYGVGWYEVVLDDTTRLSLWWDGSHWSDDAGGNDRWSQNAADSMRLLWAEPEGPPVARNKPEQQ